MGDHEWTAQWHGDNGPPPANDACSPGGKGISSLGHLARWAAAGPLRRLGQCACSSSINFLFGVDLDTSRAVRSLQTATQGPTADHKPIRSRCRRPALRHRRHAFCRPRAVPALAAVHVTRGACWRVRLLPYPGGALLAGAKVADTTARRWMDELPVLSSPVMSCHVLPCPVTAGWPSLGRGECALSTVHRPLPSAARRGLRLAAGGPPTRPTPALGCDGSVTVCRALTMLAVRWTNAWPTRWLAGCVQASKRAGVCCLAFTGWAAVRWCCRRPEPHGPRRLCRRGRLAACCAAHTTQAVGVSMPHHRQQSNGPRRKQRRAGDRSPPPTMEQPRRGSSSLPAALTRARPPDDADRHARPCVLLSGPLVLQRVLLRAALCTPQPSMPHCFTPTDVLQPQRKQPAWQTGSSARRILTAIEPDARRLDTRVRRA